MIEVEVTSPIIEMLNQYGFATVAAIAMGWFIYFIYTYVTQNIITYTLYTTHVYTRDTCIYMGFDTPATSIIKVSI